jgi:hypothetical protein
MAYAIHDAGEPGMSGRPSRRSREQVARTRSVRFDLSEAEYAEIPAAAVRYGQSRGAYAAVVTLAAARGLSRTRTRQRRRRCRQSIAPHCRSARTGST